MLVTGRASLRRLAHECTWCSLVGSAAAPSREPTDRVRGVGLPRRRPPFAGAACALRYEHGPRRAECGAGHIATVWTRLAGGERRGGRLIEGLRATRCTTGNSRVPPGLARHARRRSRRTRRAVQARQDRSAAHADARVLDGNMTPPSREGCPLTVTVPGEYMVWRCGRAAINRDESSASNPSTARSVGRGRS